MDPNKLNFVYFNTKAKHLIHLLFWIMLYLFLCFFNHRPLFSSDPFSFESIIGNAIFLSSIMLNHYVFFLLLLPLIKKKKWLILIFSCFVLYIITLGMVTFPLWLMHVRDYSNNGYRIQYEFYGIQGWSDILSYGPMLWAFTTVFFYNLGTILLKTAIDFHQSQQEKLIVMKERNLMELNFLRMQIQPHFLFNTLNNIYGMVLENEQAASSITRLSDLLRFSINGCTKEWISLQEEVLFLNNYLELEMIRHKNEKLQMTSSFPDHFLSEQKIRPLLLVNFIENAFKHGVNSSSRPSWVNLSMNISNSILKFQVANSKPLNSSSPSKFGRVNSDGGKRIDQEERIGLANVRRRLELEYPEKHTLVIRETDSEFMVELALDLN